MYIAFKWAKHIGSVIIRWSYSIVAGTNKDNREIKTASIKKLNPKFIGRIGGQTNDRLL